MAIELQERMRAHLESSSAESHESKKRIAMLEQQHEFLGLQLMESKEAHEEHLRQHENMLRTLQISPLPDTAGGKDGAGGAQEAESAAE